MQQFVSLCAEAGQELGQIFRQLADFRYEVMPQAYSNVAA